MLTPPPPIMHCCEGLAPQTSQHASTRGPVWCGSAPDWTQRWPSKWASAPWNGSFVTMWRLGPGGWWVECFYFLFFLVRRSHHGIVSLKKNKKPLIIIPCMTHSSVRFYLQWFACCKQGVTFWRHFSIRTANPPGFWLCIFDVWVILKKNTYNTLIFLFSMNNWRNFSPRSVSLFFVSGVCLLASHKASLSLLRLSHGGGSTQPNNFHSEYLFPLCATEELLLCLTSELPFEVCVLYCLLTTSDSISKPYFVKLHEFGLSLMILVFLILFIKTNTKSL